MRVELVNSVPLGCVEILNDALGKGIYEKGYLDGLLADGVGCLVTAVAGDGELVGCGTALVLDEEFEEFELPDMVGCGFLESVALLPKWQGLGIGRRMAELRIDWLWDQQVPAILAMCWESPSPRRSRPVLERLGFEVVKHIYDPWITEACPYCGQGCRCPAIIMRLTRILDKTVTLL